MACKPSESEFYRGEHLECLRISDEACEVIGEYLARGGRMVFFDTPNGTIRTAWVEAVAWVN